MNYNDIAGGREASRRSASATGQPYDPGDPAARMQVESLILGKILVAVGYAVAPSQMRSATVEQHVDHVSGRLTTQLRVYLMGQQEDKSEYHESVVGTEEVPLTWWDFAKVSLRKRMPTLCGRLKVQVRTIEVTRKATTTIHATRICPHIHVPGDENDMHIRFLVGGSPSP